MPPWPPVVTQMGKGYASMPTQAPERNHPRASRFRFRMSKSDLRARPIHHHTRVTRSRPTSPLCSPLSPSPAGSSGSRTVYQEHHQPRRYHTIEISAGDQIVTVPCHSRRPGPIWSRSLRMEEAMAARSVAWDTGEAIPGTAFRHMIQAADTGRRFSIQSAVLRPGRQIRNVRHARLRRGRARRS
jgi:hypothetical protein